MTEASSPSALSGRVERWAIPAVIILGLALAIFAFYFGTYPARHAQLPAGFDAPWYVWRAQFVAVRGIGPVGTALRPGHAVLSGVLGAVTGLSQLKLVVVFSQLLPVLLALVVGAFAWNLPRSNRAGWVTVIAVTGAVLGATRLVGENLANLLNVALEVGALALLVSAGNRGWTVLGAIALLVAAGLAHWIFLAVIGLVLIGDVIVTGRLSGSVRPPLRVGLDRERSAMVWVTVITGVILAVLVGAVLRAPFRTFQIAIIPREFAPKFVTDLSRLWLVGVLAVPGVFAMNRLRKGRPVAEIIATSFAMRLLVIWAAVTVFGVLVALLSLKVPSHSLPPHRFLALVVALPGVIAASEAIGWGSRWVRRSAERPRRGGTGPRRTAAAAATVVVVVAVGALGAISAERWYRYPVLMGRGAQQEADTLAGYIEQLPPGTQFVVVVDGQGPADIYSATLRERMLRVAIPADRQEQLHLFVGSPADLLAGRRTHFTRLIDRVTEPYWNDVRKVLPMDPPVAVLEDMGGLEFHEALGMGAKEVAPGVAFLRGPAPSAPLPVAPLPDAVPGFIVALGWGAFLLVLLAAAGAGWARLFLGPGVAPEAELALAPVIGSGMLLLGGFVAAEAGVRLHGVGGILTFVVITVAGAVGALAASRRPQSLTGERTSGLDRGDQRAPGGRSTP